MALTAEEEEYLRKKKRIDELNSQIKAKEKTMWSKVKTMKGSGDRAGVQTEKKKFRTDVSPLKDELETIIL